MGEDKMTRDDVERLLDGTTPGPWVLDGMTSQRATMEGKMHRIKLDGVFAVFVAGWGDNQDEAKQGDANARLITAAPDLARRVLELEAEVERLRGALEEIERGWTDEADPDTGVLIQVNLSEDEMSDIARAARKGGAA
jgi:hypothetical protein